jgi:hypothetical protein
MSTLHLAVARPLTASIGTIIAELAQVSGLFFTHFSFMEGSPKLVISLQFIGR